MHAIAHKYFIRDLNFGPDARDFLDRLSGSIEKQCSAYLEDLTSGKYSPSSKIFQDSMWGFLSFTPAEVVIIDSPLFQRLRNIRQLGFAYLLFPNAGYSRFEHSLGVCHVIGEYVRTLRESQPRSTGEEVLEIENLDVQILRLAALLHDTGHICYSHVSERCWKHFRAGKAIEEIREALTDRFACRERPSDSEIVAACIVLTKTVSSLIEICTTKGWLNIDVRIAIERICEYIIGGATEPKRWFLTEMLNGDMDADKLDYIQRDCMVTGVPLPFDVKRLILKARLLKGTDHRGDFTRLAISFGGAHALLDLTVSRMMLREKIYRHFKILAAESMFEGLLRTVAGLDPDFISPDSFMLMDDAYVLNFFEQLDFKGTHSDKGSNPEVSKLVCALATALKQRRLLKRAFVFSAHFLISGKTTDDQAHLMKLVTDPAAVAQFKADILEELGNLLKTLGKPDQCPEHTEWITIASSDLTGGAAGQRHQPLIVDERGKQITDPEARDHLSLQTDWANAHESGGSLHYVFCPEHVRVECHVAVRNVLYKKHSLIFKKTSMLFSKISESQVEVVDKEILKALRHQGNQADCFEYENLISSCTKAVDNPLDGKLASVLLQISNSARDAILERKEQVDLKLSEVSSYRGPQGHRVTDRLLLAWVNGFPAEFQRDALELFLRMKYLDRDDFADTIRKITDLLDDKKQTHELCICPLTSSSEFMIYYSGDAQLSETISIKSVQTVSKAIQHIIKAGPSATRVLVIVDDVLGMGIQSADVLRIWVGEEPEYESHSIGEVLSPEAQGWLREGKCKVVFLFAFALKEGISEMEKNLSHHGIDAKVIAHIESSVKEGIFSLSDDDIWCSRNHLDSFKEYCSKVGESLLAERASIKKWSSEKLRERALGYGGASQLIATSYNCPTISLPIVWAEGSFNSKEWLPLFLRRFRS